MDPNLVPPRRYWPPLSDEERETLAAQQALTAAERAVLAAALTGGDLEGALAALPEGYADAWKNDVRRLAASYNAGDIRVDVTGGTIAAEGNGVEALYAVPHERNGGIAVRVAEGASVSGGANGLYLSGAGAGAGNFLAQSVSIDGRVAGGAGAGVYMKGGGRLAVGAAGRISAASGVGRPGGRVRGFPRDGGGEGRRRPPRRGRGRFYGDHFRSGGRRRGGAGVGAIIR